MPKFENESEKPAQEESLYVPGAHRKEHPEEGSENEGSNLRSRWRRPRSNEPSARQENTRQEGQESVRQEGGRQGETTSPRRDALQNRPSRNENMGRMREGSSGRRERERFPESSQKSRSFDSKHRRREHHEERQAASSTVAKEISLYQKLKDQIIKLLGLVDKEHKDVAGEGSRKASCSNRRFSSQGGKSERRRGGNRPYRHKPYRGGSSRQQQKEKN